MKLTWTFYKAGQSVTLTVIYVASLDTQNLLSGGYLDIDANTAYVNWETFKRFNSKLVAERKDAFGMLQRLPDNMEYRDERLLYIANGSEFGPNYTSPASEPDPPTPEWTEQQVKQAFAEFEHIPIPRYID
ncbi:hypothetical protein [Spirosoma jeollabukense]